MPWHWDVPKVSLSSYPQAAKASDWLEVKPFQLPMHRKVFFSRQFWNFGILRVGIVWQEIGWCRLSPEVLLTLQGQRLLAIIYGIYIYNILFVLNPTPWMWWLEPSKGPCRYLAVRSFHQGAISPFQVFEMQSTLCSDSWSESGFQGSSEEHDRGKIGVLGRRRWCWQCPPHN